MNKAYLLSKLALKQCKNKELAELLGVKPSTLSVKMRLDRFSVKDVKVIKKRLALSKEEIHTIFFEE